MRPRMRESFNENGRKNFVYMCELKEKSRCHNCQMKNPNGNILDKVVCEEIKKLAMDNSEFLRDINKAKKEISMQK